ncbi:MAG: hypothetical protein ACRCX7_12640 [Cetobacterium sp.]|uniref:hypothetical protein n=1 Tax=Cetobacterium sp. TaxID=2071632 RepID=UPI003F40648F
MKRVSWEYVNRLFEKVDVLLVELEKETDQFEVLAIRAEISHTHKLINELTELMDAQRSLF